MNRMIVLAAVLSMLALPAYAASSSTSSSSSSSSYSNNNSSRNSESHSSSSLSQDDARDALKAGKVMPLPAILDSLIKHVPEPSTVLDVDLETEDGVLTYKIDLLTEAGTRVQARVNARTGKFIRIRVGER